MFEDIQRNGDVLIIRPMLHVPDDQFDWDRSRSYSDANFFRYSFVAINDLHCPFDLHFGRGEHAGRFNFYIGLGAEFCGYEPACTVEERQQLGADVLAFLRSEIVCRETIGPDGSVAKAVYSAGLLSVDGRPTELTFFGAPMSWRSRLLRRTSSTATHRTYEPWLLDPWHKG